MLVQIARRELFEDILCRTSFLQNCEAGTGILKLKFKINLGRLNRTQHEGLLAQARICVAGFWDNSRTDDWEMPGGAPVMPMAYLHPSGYRSRTGLKFQRKTVKISLILLVPRFILPNFAGN